MEQQNDLNFGTFAITGISSAGSPGNAERLILTDGKTKLTLWASKKDGTPTKAKLAYDAIKPQLNQVINVGVKEEPKTFKNEKGEVINFMSRTIMWLGQPTQNSQPYQPIQLQAPQPAPDQQPANTPTDVTPPTPTIPTVEEQKAEQDSIDLSDIPF